MGREEKRGGRGGRGGGKRQSVKSKK